MDELRAQLERRRSSLDSLSRPSHVLDWLLRHGRAMVTPLQPWNAAERRLIALLSRALRFRRAECYANAQRAVLLASRIGALAAGHAFEYWEGYAHLPMPAPFSHGWCVLNGRAWDPSLDHLEVQVRYLGVAIPTSFIRGALSRRRTFAPLLPAWTDHVNGVGETAVERTERVGSTLRARSDLAGAPSRL